MNLQTVVVQCFDCNVEILDKDMYDRLLAGQEGIVEVDVQPLRQLCLS